MTLFSAPNDPWSHRTRIVLAEKGISIDIVSVEAGRFPEDLLDLNPYHSVPTLVDRDEHPRPTTTADALSKLRPAFAKEGTVTAGNASGINDGAAATVVMSRERAESLGPAPLAVVRSWASVGLAPG